ncbi:hypothetical protein FA13DRAFT_210507 [Coprinellus micaceus]|uniref:Uncharacterized protein n=1 Tax=Coprinellus micaceus TaxID=71717 RepID=A0A4Y7SH49_COPMI|nr:hypothetical protein FA13DRAFT_210507 [Coprinellus micaceus]
MHQSREHEMISNYASDNARSGPLSVDQVPIRPSCARPDHIMVARAMAQMLLCAGHPAMPASHTLLDPDAALRPDGSIF